MRNQQSETGQISLFAADYSPQRGPYSVPTVEWSTHQREAERLAGNLLALSRATDPITSKVAAEKTKEFRVRHMSKIWGALKDFGPMNFKEIAQRIGLDPAQVARRRKEMEENRIIKVLSETRNGCALWEAL